MVRKSSEPTDQAQAAGELPMLTLLVPFIMTAAIGWVRWI